MLPVQNTLRFEDDVFILNLFDEKILAIHPDAMGNNSCFIGPKCSDPFRRRADSLARKAGRLAPAISEWKKDYAITRNPETARSIARLYALNEETDSSFHWLDIALIRDSTPDVLLDDQLFSSIGIAFEVPQKD